LTIEQVDGFLWKEAGRVVPSPVTGKEGNRARTEPRSASQRVDHATVRDHKKALDPGPGRQFPNASTRLLDSKVKVRAVLPSRRTAEPTVVESGQLPRPSSLNFDPVQPTPVTDVELPQAGVD